MLQLHLINALYNLTSEAVKETTESLACNEVMHPES